MTISFLKREIYNSQSEAFDTFENKTNDYFKLNYFILYDIMSLKPAK